MDTPESFAAILQREKLQEVASSIWNLSKMVVANNGKNLQKMGENSFLNV